MCTLTWERTAQGYRLLFNRDENLTRPEALAPSRLERSGRSIVAPTDPQGGGTWIAVNDAGLTLCLLNDYQGRPPEAALVSPKSRGLLVKELATCVDEREVTRRIRKMDLSHFPPFTLLAFGLSYGPIAWHHHAESLTLNLAPEAPMTSSGQRPDEVHRHRKRAFRRLRARRGGTLPLQDLRAYHRGDFTPPGALSVAMSRPGRGTVSVTEVEVEHDEARMSYYPGHPSQTRLKEPSATVSVSLSASVTREQALPISEDLFALDSLFAEKNPKLHRKIPRSAFALLDRITGAAQINRALTRLGPVPPSGFAQRGLASVFVETFVQLPASERPDQDAPPPIYVANHPLGGVDGLALVTFVQHLHGSVVVPVNDILLRIPHARSFGVGIDKSRTSKGLVDAINRTFESGAPVVVFPAGKTSRKQAGELQDSPWGKMVVRRALRHQRPIVPVFVSGENSALFYLVHRLRTRLGIGANLEMFLLPREVLRPSIERLHLVVGEQLSPEDLTALGSNDWERAQALRARCYSLEALVPGRAGELRS